MKLISFLLFVALQLECIQAFTTFSTPIMGLGAILFRPKNLVVNPNLGEDNELVDAAKCFTDAFWAGKAGGAKELSPKQLKSLGNSQIAEFRKRYGSKLRNKAQDRRAELVVCKNDQSGDIYGCAGIEVSSISTPNGKRTKFAGPLMSNLAVGRKYRRKGIAEDLVKATEELALKEWGYDECYLFVEKKNAPALKLYKKLGYKVQWEDDTATTLVPTQKGSVVSKPTVILCMKKVLGKGVFGRFFG